MRTLFHSCNWSNKSLFAKSSSLYSMISEIISISLSNFNFFFYALKLLEGFRIFMGLLAETTYSTDSTVYTVSCWSSSFCKFKTTSYGWWVLIIAKAKTWRSPWFIVQILNLIALVSLIKTSLHHVLTMSHYSNLHLICFKRSFLWTWRILFLYNCWIISIMVLCYLNFYTSLIVYGLKYIVLVIPIAAIVITLHPIFN